MLPNRLALLLAVGCLAFAPPAFGAETSLTMNSEPGDYVGQGRTWFYDDHSAVFTPALLGDGTGVQMFVNSGNYTNWWYLNFGAAQGALLEPGTYVGATRYLGFPGKTPGIDVYGNGAGCNQQAGAFQVKQITVSNGTVTKLWVRFEQHCEGNTPALTGDLRFNADVSVVVTSPLSRRVPVGQTVTFDVSATSVGPNRVTLTPESLPQGATFSDHGDNTGTFSWTPSDDQVGTYPVTFIGDASSGQDRSTTVIEILERPLTGDTSLRMDSEAGDYIGQGQSWLFGAADGTFQGFSQNTGNLARLSFFSAQHSWDLDFAGIGGAALAPGFYRDAKRYPFQGSTNPGLGIAGDGRGCNMLTGAFEIKQLVVSGTTVTRFWARFEQHCEGFPPALTGEIRLNADVTVAVVAPFHPRLQSGRPETVAVTGTASAGGHVTLNALDLPAGAAFEDLGDNTGRLTWTPVLGQRGTYLVVFVGDDGLGHQDKSTSLLEVSGSTSLDIDSEPEEPIAHGTDAHYGAQDGVFLVSQNFYDNSVNFRFNKPDYSVEWNFTLAAPGNAVVTPGNYEGALGYPFAANDHPRLGVSGYSTGCQDLTGRFVVRQAEYGPDNTVTAFWATFEETCTGFTTPLRAELRYNASVITDVTAPSADTLGPGQPLEFAVTATNANGRRVVLSANGVPQGASFVDHGDNTGTFAWTPTFDQIGSYRVSFIGDDGAGGMDSATTRILVPGETSLTFEQSPSGPHVLTPADGKFTGSRNAENLLRLAFTRSDRYTGFNLNFGAPLRAALTPGFYPGASVLQVIGGSAPAPTYPILEVTENGSSVYCNPLLGIFQVKQLVIGDGGAIQSFWATFEEDCSQDGGTSVGEIRFNARIQVAVHAPLRKEVAPGRQFEIAVRADDRLAKHVTLSASGLPPGASFLDHGDNTGILTWTPGLDAIGLHDVTFSGDNGSGGVDHADCHIRVTGQVRLVIDGDAQDPVGGQRSGVFTPANGPFQVSKNYKEGVSLHFRDNASYYLGEWFLSMAGPHDAPLAPGLYQPVAYYPSEPDDVPGLAVTHGYDPCSGIDGKFEIQQITYGPGIEITSLRATFEQHCSGSPAAVRGELRWQYDAPVLVTAPAAIDTSDSALIRFAVSAVARAGGIVGLTATGLPEGASFVDHGDNTGTFEWTPTAQQVGDHVVTFHAKTTAGDEDSTGTRIHVRHDNRPPVARIAFASPVLPGVPVIFDGSGSYDPDGDALQHYWYFSDDFSYASGPVVTHTFARAGTFLVAYQVYDNFAAAFAETLVHVQSVLPARAFVEGGNAVVRPASGKPTTCVRIEPRDAAWTLANVVLSSIRMVSTGTGTVSLINALPGQTAVDKDTDHNGIAEIEACFAKSDLEQLFSGSSGRTTVQVALEGELASGDRFRGTMDLPVARPGRALAAQALPTVGLHGYRLTFVTTKPGSIQARLFDVTGRIVRTLADLDQAQAGAHEFVIDRSDLASGVYFYRIVTPEGVAGGKMVLLQ